MASMRATATWTGGFRTVLEDDRGHQVVVDLPREEGGTDEGTSALELNILSLAGCISTIFALVARRRHLVYSALRVDLEGFRPKGSRTVGAAKGSLRIRTSGSREEVETVLRLTLRTCPVGLIYDEAGIPVEIEVLLEADGGGAPGPATSECPPRVATEMAGPSRPR